MVICAQMMRLSSFLPLMVIKIAECVILVLHVKNLCLEIFPVAFVSRLFFLVFIFGDI